MSDDHKMRDFEVALMDAIRTICEVLVAKKIIPAEVLAEAFRLQREGYPKEHMPGAIFVMNTIADTLTDPVRGEVRKFQQEPPQGSA
jgi:hypothetical protein